jgi:glycosyltransferase involved in cell wall biosynthesis
MVQDRCHDWVLDIYGVGDQTPYRHLFQKLGIDDRRCHMYDSLTDVQNAYLNSSIFVLPSRFEGFSLVIIEAMSCGVPVVSFDCENGPRNIIFDGQNGFLVPPFDIDVYAERLLTLMEHDDLRQGMGLEAHRTSCQYQIEDIALRWKALFDEVVDEQ